MNNSNIIKRNISSKSRISSKTLLFGAKLVVGVGLGAILVVGK